MCVDVGEKERGVEEKEGVSERGEWVSAWKERVKRGDGFNYY